MLYVRFAGRQHVWRALVLTWLMALPLGALAQTITGHIAGRVTDSSGGALPGVTVTVLNENTGFTVTRVTDGSGAYVFTNLPVGRYTVSTELEGFTGSGTSVEDCLNQARAGMKEHVELLVEHGLPVPPQNPDPVVTIRNEQKEAAA